MATIPAARWTPLLVCASLALMPWAFVGCQDENYTPLTAEQRDFDGLMPLHRAAANGEIAELESMLQAHADPDLRDAAMVTPIHYAARSGHLAAVRMLVSYGADPNAKTHNGWTALQIAMREGHLNIVHFLSQYGFDPNGLTPDGEVMLVFAMRTQNTEMIQFLIERRADMNIRTPNGRTILEEAFARRDLDLINTLLDYGAEVPHQLPGRSPLAQAVEWGELMLVKRLLARGADPTIRDSAGRDALALARLHGQDLIAEHLIYHLQSTAQPPGGL